LAGKVGWLGKENPFLSKGVGVKRQRAGVPIKEAPSILEVVEVVLGPS